MVDLMRPAEELICNGMLDAEVHALEEKWRPPPTTRPWSSTADLPVSMVRNLHVRGYKEEGTTTTPFDMVMLNDLESFDLVMDVIDRPRVAGKVRATSCS